MQIKNHTCLSINRKGIFQKYLTFKTNNKGSNEKSRWNMSGYYSDTQFKISTLCDKVCQWLATGQWFSPDPLVSSTDKTDRHGITEILLKVALNTINQTNKNIYDNTQFWLGCLKQLCELLLPLDVSRKLPVFQRSSLKPSRKLFQSFETTRPMASKVALNHPKGVYYNFIWLLPIIIQHGCCYYK